MDVGDVFMNLQTFKAATMAEALSQVKKNLGQDAVILQTRTVEVRKWLGLRKSEMVEITAGRGQHFPTRNRKTEKPTPRMATTNAPGRDLLATTAASNVMMVSL